MEKVAGNILAHYPFADAVKLRDLLYYEEPILTHYVYKERDLLKYLLDFNDVSTRYLIFQIEEYDLFKLISGHETILDLISYSSEDFTFLYVVDENQSGQTITTYQITIDELNSEYLPTENSYLRSTAITDMYEELINQYSETYYIEELRKKAYFLRFEPANKEFDGSLGLVELSKLLTLVTTSFRNFTKIDFIKYFSDKIADKGKLNRIYNGLTDYMDSRAVEFRFGSFEVGIAIDHIMKKGKAPKDVQQWLDGVEEKFKETVLQLDYSSETEVNNVIEALSYSQKEIESIYKPILKISQDSDYNFEYKPTDNSIYREIVVTNSKIIDRLSPTPPKKAMEDELLPTEIEYINVLMAKPKGKELTTKIRLENTLFSNTDTHVLTNAHFEKEGYPITFDIQLVVNLSQANGESVVSTIYDNNVFEENGQSDNLGAIMARVIKRIAEYIFERDNLDK